MSRPPHIPEALKAGPFTLAMAREHGISDRQLAGRFWRRLDHAIYVWAGLPQTPRLLIEAARMRLPPEAVFTAMTAAWLMGRDVRPGPPIEALVARPVGVADRRRMRLRQAVTTDDEVTVIDGYRVTTGLRTIVELAISHPLATAVMVADMILRMGQTTPEEVRMWAVERPRYPGRRAVLAVADLADGGAESPMETRLRLALVRAGLPRPLTQFEIRDGSSFVARVDLYYPAANLAIEFDGGVHRDQLVADNRRQNLLLASGVKLLRFTGADLREREPRVVEQVRAALGASAGSRRPTGPDLWVA